MSLLATKEVRPDSDEESQSHVTTCLDQCFSRLGPGREVAGALATTVALVSLLAFWALRVYFTWGTWGNLSIDSGREMYVPTVLLKGKLLYRDIWYLYGPIAPYINSELFHWFGTRLEVLYWAGSLSALCCAALLLLIGKRLSSIVVGWTAGAVVLLQAFQPGLFSFPLAYSFASVYGCLVGCLFLYLVILSTRAEHPLCVFTAGVAAALALLLKLEFGVACYAALFLLVVARRRQRPSWKDQARDLAAILPGLVGCGLVIGWMVSLRGFEFLTQENILSWPTSYFMRQYGKMWLEGSGFSLNAAAFLWAAIRALCYAAILFETYLLLWRKCRDRRSLYLRLGLLLIVGAYLSFHFASEPKSTLSAVFFPRDTVLYVSAASLVAWWYFWRRNFSVSSLPIAILLTFSSLVAFRILLHMSPSGYSIYYDGPAVLSFLLLARLIVPQFGRSSRFVSVGEMVICLGCLAAVVLESPRFPWKPSEIAPLATDRGTIFVEKREAESYQAAIQFMKEKAAQGESILSVPEDTSLYFLSGVDCPTRVCAFTPGLVAPGKMTDELIQAIERKGVRYLLWSNRTFPEYGVTGFGIDFNQDLGNYLKSHYHRSRMLVPNDADFRRLNFVVWERNTADQAP